MTRIMTSIPSSPSHSSGRSASGEGTSPGRADSRQGLAARLARLRADGQRTLEKLAEESGVSRAFISQIESQRGNPTLATLDRLAAALGVRTADLLAGDSGQPDFEPVIRPTRPVGDWPPGTGRTYQLSAAEAQRFAVHLTDGAAADHNRWIEHPGEEFCIVLAGAYHLQVGGTDLRLEAGESAHYPGRRPHRISPAGTGGRVLVVFGPVEPVWR
jgi:transcriptional regulator with XRE-family HTH domain